VGHSASFTSKVHCFKDSIFQVQINFLSLIILASAFTSILDSGDTTSQIIINFFSVKKIPPIFAFHKTISTSLGSSIPVIIFSILSVI
jgi:hypothetical protein